MPFGKRRHDSWSVSDEGWILALRLQIFTDEFVNQSGSGSWRRSRLHQWPSKMWKPVLWTVHQRGSLVVSVWQRPCQGVGEQFLLPQVCKISFVDESRKQNYIWQLESTLFVVYESGCMLDIRTDFLVGRMEFDRGYCFGREAGPTSTIVGSGRCPKSSPTTTCQCSPFHIADIFIHCHLDGSC